MTPMRRFSVPLVLLAILICSVAKSDTLELPRTTKVVPGSRYVITADRLADGKLVGERLEHLSNVWDLLFAEFIKKEPSAASPNTIIEPAQHRLRVILYRNEKEYIDSLRSIEPGIERTNGLYHTPKKTAHFSSTEAKILFHEGTHQILAERFFYEKRPAFRNNFWVVEGIALFMETLKIEDKRYKIGNVLADRLYSAKVYRFERNHNLPIRNLAAMSAVEIQSSKELQEIYSQSAALTHWLMFAEEGRYRGALFELLRQTYRDEATPEALSELTGLSFEELDKRYAEFLQTIPD